MYLIIGLLVGFIAAIPIGPINVFAITQTMKRDFLHGLLVGLTSALMDIVFCFIAIAGMHTLSSSIKELLPYIKLFGIVVILFIASRLIHQARHFDKEKASSQSTVSTVPRPIIGALLLYITNPGLYMFWFAVGGTVTAHHLVHPAEWSGPLFALTTGIGTTIWYIVLCRYVAKYHHQFSPRTFTQILRVTALILLGLATYTAITLVI
jgi:L-lysine exporter family protein LysE/ArgO